MVTFLANRANLQSKRLHDRIATRLRGEFTDVRRRRADPHEAGPYRVVGEIDPRQYLGDAEYPTTAARVEIGFQLGMVDPDEHYWINWLEPDRRLLVAWHQDDTHAELGPVHLQVTDGSQAVTHHPAPFIDVHPLDVVARRLAHLPDAVGAVEWEDGRPVGLDSAASVLR